VEPSAIKQRIPFTVRHRGRQILDELRKAPRHYASGSFQPRTRLGRLYGEWYRARHFRAFFTPLLGSGDLAFDVGANVGLWTDGLVRVGCRVVAVEPQRACADRIRERHREDSRVDVVVAAVGGGSGETELFLTDVSEFASTSRRWMSAMVERGGYPPELWDRAVTVPMLTLDDLIGEYGVPSYVKLDIEGSEPDALRGLSRPVRLLSFETHGHTLSDAAECVGRLGELGRYEFNLSPGEFPAFEWRDWRGDGPLLEALESFPFGWHNVFARLAA
jgi:FkbM family methyltransferase